MKIEVTEEELKNLKEIRNYFGEHDKTLFEHKAYAVLDGLIKNIFESKTNKDMKQSTQKGMLQLLKDSLPHSDTLERVEFDEVSNSIYFYWVGKRFKLELNSSDVLGIQDGIVMKTDASILMTHIIKNQIDNQKKNPTASESDEKLLKDIMNAVEKQDHLDASIGKSVRELAEQGYKVIVEKSNVNHNQINVDVDSAGGVIELHRAGVKYSRCHDNDPVPVDQKCINCKFYTHYPHNVTGVAKKWSADGYCNNMDNSRKIIVIDSKTDFCKFFQPC